MKRYQFDISESDLAYLQTLTSDLGFANKKDLINNAISLFTWALKEKQAGRIIASIDEVNNKYKEVLLPVFLNVKPVQPINPAVKNKLSLMPINEG